MNISETSSQALPAGTCLEEFVVERVLGTGGFGITYLARDSGLGRHVVIKENLPVQFCCRDTSSLTVAPRHAHSDDADNFQWSLENFSKEAGMLAALDHPGIVTVHRSFEAFGTAYFVMPFVEGLAFDELIDCRTAKEQPFSEEELRSLLKYTLRALSYLHERGIYHRDIKPGNILMTKERFPVLIDFGSARQRLSERSMTVVESAGYTPFEQLQSRGDVGPWSDLYALGATMVKAITGDAPPKAADRVYDDPWVPLAERKDLKAHYSGELLESIDRALDPQVSPRFQESREWQGAIGGLGSEIADSSEVLPVGQREDNDVKAQSSSGAMHATGSDIAKDEAKKLHRKVAEQGDADAAAELAAMYMWGRGVARDYEEAMKWFEKAKSLWRREHGLSIRDVQVFHEYNDRPKLGASMAIAFSLWIILNVIVTLIFGLGSVILTGEEAGFLKYYFGKSDFLPALTFWGIIIIFIIRWGTALHKASRGLSEAGWSQEKRSACRSYFKFVKSLYKSLNE